MSEYKIGKYITLRLINDKTIIFIDNKEFLQCKRLFLDIPIERLKSTSLIESVDDIEEKFENSLGIKENLINPSEEFWAHCSNLQV